MLRKLIHKKRIGRNDKRNYALGPNEGAPKTPIDKLRNLDHLKNTRQASWTNVTAWKQIITLTVTNKFCKSCYASRKPSDAAVRSEAKLRLGRQFVNKVFAYRTFEAIMQKLAREKIVQEKRVLDRIWLKNDGYRPLFFTFGRWQHEKRCFYAKKPWVCSKIEVPKWRENGAKNALNSLKTVKKTRFGS